ncbi:MAG: CapA family protein [Gemmatimonadetes bacterium]|uniref:CapA family protein n=1 Tax=Candidatus Kutchimonas denitrificans TaxID=3056748 RepID=A0AAE4Z9W9_9BACT|nr:CapA family protein [Gemmatimonadota bacterium]NIR75979.1 CapA family protein [Candidatus Kutchimonas denitrificans]NIS02171.1 CapA family protein [Gemmatimonadota bacterium]NIT67997.1 CapA family protein [Gemmatimonadota bacterium]NIU54023.1 poly-gamma-glutamate biosynthesis protein [Gemmatimonadota bacterium]
MNRREFLARSGILSLAVSLARYDDAPGASAEAGSRTAPESSELTLFLAGDVMTGRGIDQVLPHSVDPVLYEPYVKSAEIYVELAERAHGPIPAEVPYDYIWGDALAELERVAPDARIINLETAVTTNDDPWAGKGIHYRMHPENVPVLTAADIDVCVLANNHTLDWAYAGLSQTVEALRKAKLATVGAGEDVDAAAEPAKLETGGGRLLIFAYGSTTAGVPPEWAPGAGKPGVNLLPGLGSAGARRVLERVRMHRREDDRVLVSIHWGPNWGHKVPASQRAFAHELIDSGLVDLVYGHSSHHPKAIEVYRDRPILYGCGDFLNDYEGIAGHERFRGHLTLMYFPTFAPAGELVGLEMTPMRIRRFRLQRASDDEARWLADTMDKESRRLGAGVERLDSGRLALRWG